LLNVVFINGLFVAFHEWRNILNHLIVCVRYGAWKYWSGLICFIFDQRRRLQPSVLICASNHLRTDEVTYSLGYVECAKRETSS